MNSKKLQRNLPGTHVQGGHRMVTITIPERGMDGIIRDRQFHVSQRAGWDERHCAEYLKSKMPVAAVPPKIY